MAETVILVVVGASSTGALLVGIAWIGLRPADLLPAAWRVLEGVGLTVGFFLLNLAAGVAIAVGSRLATNTFVSMYYTNDVALLGISLLQGLLYQWWREGGRAR